MSHVYNFVEKKSEEKEKTKQRRRAKWIFKMQIFMNSKQTLLFSAEKDLKLKF